MQSSTIRMMNEIPQQIKEKIDIVEFIKQYVEVQNAGRNFKARCPFHSEKTPSFMISPDRQTWRCFGGCNEGGDIFQFLMKYENIEFYEALKILADKAGIELKKNNSTSAEYKQFGVLYDINASAARYFQQHLSGISRDYLMGRGLQQQTIDEFEIGFAPNTTRDALLRYLIDAGFNAPDIERSGLVFRTDKGTYWDRFRDRIMFPIHNSFGKIVGFTGRILPSADPGNVGKYVNSPETPIFNKSRLLYGLHKAKKDIRDQKYAILVEGQMDVIMSYQDGVRNVVASSGTALTIEQLATLRRLTDSIVLNFDSDEAGLLAAERSIDLANAQDFSVRVLVLKEKDPADVVKSHPGEFAKLVAQAKSAIDFYSFRYLENPDSIKRNVRIVLAKAKKIYSSIERSQWIKKIVEKTGISENDLLEEMNALPKESQATSLYRQQQPIKKISTERWSKYQWLAQKIVDLGGGVPAELVKNNSEELVLKVSLEHSTLNEADKKKELVSAMRMLKSDLLKQKMHRLQSTIQQTEKMDKPEALGQLLKEFDIASKEFHNTHHGSKKDSQ